MPIYDPYINAVFNRAMMAKRETKVERTLRDTHLVIEMQGLGFLYHPATWNDGAYWSRRGVKVQAS